MSEELPTGWIAARLGDVADDISYGYTASADVNANGPKFLRITDIQNGQVNWQEVPRCPMPDNPRFLLSDQDIVIARTGATTGKSFLIEGLNEPAVFASYLIKVRAGGGVFPKYLSRFMESPSYWGQVQQVSKGTAQPGANASILSDLDLPIAPALEQHRIVAKIDSLFARSSRARDELAHIPKLIERYRQAVLEAAFKGDLTADWRENQGLGSWQTVTVEDVAITIFDGPFGSHLKSDDYSGSGIRVVRLENIGRMSFAMDRETYITTEKYEKLLRHTLIEKDVLFSSFVAEQIRVCLFPGGMTVPAINKADCFCVRLDGDKCIPEFLMYRLAEQSAYEYMRDQVHGATRPRVNLGHLKRFAFSLPSLSEQAEIVSKIAVAFASAERIEAEKLRAEVLSYRLDQSILDQAFTGKLVPQDPTDEPASNLLERIQAARAAAPKAKRGRRAKGG